MQRSHFASSLAKTKGASAEKAGEGMANAKNKPSVKVMDLKFMVLPSALLFLDNDTGNAHCRHGRCNKPCWTFECFSLCSYEQAQLKSLGYGEGLTEWVSSIRLSEFQSY